MRMIQRVAFRLCALYFVLYFLPFPVDAVFEPPGAPAWYARFWDPPVNALGRVFGIHAPLHTVDGPDGLGHCVQLGSFFLVAALATGVWTALDRRWPHDERAHDFLILWLRYALAAWMLAFGFAKVIPSQMALPDPSLMVTPYGESTPMRLLWAFMGTSPAYERFAGAAELAGGLLLLRRRTTALGALVCAAVLANVAMMNVCYDVPVKLDAIHLFLLSTFLLLPSSRRLVDTLVLGRAVPALAAPALFPVRWRRPISALAILFVAGVIYKQGSASGRHYFDDARGDGSPLPDPYGVYEVEEMRRDGVVVAPLLTDATYWHRLYFGRLGAGVVYADGSRETLALPGSTRGTWTSTRYAVKVTHAEDGRLLVEGTVNGQKVVAIARPTDPKNRRLLQSSIHWYFD